jgi:hypothetical protein
MQCRLLKMPTVKTIGVPSHPYATHMRTKHGYKRLQTLVKAYHSLSVFVQH